jgi:hypothetical protein
MPRSSSTGTRMSMQETIQHVSDPNVKIDGLRNGIQMKIGGSGLVSSDR